MERQGHPVDSEIESHPAAQAVHRGLAHRSDRELGAREGERRLFRATVRDCVRREWVDGARLIHDVVLEAVDAAGGCQHVAPHAGFPGHPADAGPPLVVDLQRLGGVQLSSWVIREGREVAHGVDASHHAVAAPADVIPEDMEARAAAQVGDRVAKEEPVEDRDLVTPLEQQLRQHRPDVAGASGDEDVLGRLPGHAGRCHWKLLSAAASRGAWASFGDNAGDWMGQVTPIAGSFQRMARSWAALYSAVAL